MSYRHDLHQEVCDYLTHLCKPFQAYGPIGKVAAADVAVRVRGRVVTVQVERPVVLVLVVVTTNVQNNARGVVVAIVVTKPETNTDYW